MSISVIIPAYNYAHFLPQTLDSVLKQATDVPVEVIVVDDGSTDATAAVAQEYGARIRYVHQHNQGLSAARNTGMRLAQGRALVFLDADDLLMPGVLASQWAALQAHPEAGISICQNYLVNAARPEDPLEIRGFYPLHKDAFAVHLCYGNIAPVHACMVRSGIAAAAGPFDTSLRACEDYDFWLRCLAAGAGFIGNPHGAVIYRKHDASMSAQTDVQFRHEAICNRRVARMLAGRPAVLRHRMMDACMAHAAGSLNRAKPLSATQPQMAAALVKQCATAVQRAEEACTLHPGDAAQDELRHMGTNLTRNADEELVLRYYTLRVMLWIRQLARLEDPLLVDAHARLVGMFPGYDRPEEDLFQELDGLYSFMHMPQDILEVMDADGVLRVEG